MSKYSNLLVSFLFFIILTSSKPDKEYNNEAYRPQFHFSPDKNLMMEPGGLVYIEGEYHMFYQYSPSLNTPESLHWGHAVSADLVHWNHLPIAISPVQNSDGEECPVNSGCIIIDENNVLSLEKGNTKTMAAFYSSMGCGVNISYSNDNGNNWERFGDKPILQFNDAEEASGPKVFWHGESGKWVMLLSRIPDNNERLKGISFYNSENLIDWEYVSNFPVLSGSPDLIKFNVDNRQNETKWVLFGGDGSYFIGSFDGKTFKTETPKLKNDFGKSFNGAKTWVNLSGNDERVLQLAMLQGGEFPGMPFNGQMNFPCELSIKTFSNGVHLLRNPVKEIKLLHGKQSTWHNKNIIPGINDNILKSVKGDCLHLICTFDIKTSDNFGIMVRHSKKNVGTEILYIVKREVLSCLGSIVPVQINDNKLKLEILIDRSSIEIFANDGNKVISSSFTPIEESLGLEIFTNGGELLVDQLDIYEMNSSWREEKKKMSMPFAKGNKEK